MILPTAKAQTRRLPQAVSSRLFNVGASPLARAGAATVFDVWHLRSCVYDHGFTKTEAAETGDARGALALTWNMIKLAEAGERIAATTKKLEKIAIVAEYLKTRTIEEASVSAVFLSGRPFPVWGETTLQIGGRVLWRIVAELSGKSEAELTAAYRQRGDLGAVAEAVLPAFSTTAHIGTGALARPGRAKPGSSALNAPTLQAMSATELQPDGCVMGKPAWPTSHSNMQNAGATP